MPAVREYLKLHPDPELAKELAETEAQQSSATAGIARTPAEREAFNELAANHLNRAQQMFVDLTVKQPTNPRALAGLGFVRMKQSNFAEAAQDFEQAQQHGLKIPLIAQSLATARFWNAMQLGTQALNANRLDDAVRQYQAALALRPGNINALSGEAGAYMRMQAPDLAVPVYQALLHRQPQSPAWWRGLFNAQAQAGQGRDAILTENKFPPALKKSVARDPDYLRNLARAYVTAGQDAQAQKTLVQAMNLKYPAGEEKIRTDITLQYAALLAQDKDYAQSSDIYHRVIRADPNNIDAWQGLVSMQHLAGHDADAIAIVERMPPDAYDSALRNGGFLSELAAIYSTQNHPDVAQGFLERAVKIYQDNGQPLPISLEAPGSRCRPRPQSPRRRLQHLPQRAHPAPRQSQRVERPHGRAPRHRPRRRRARADSGDPRTPSANSSPPTLNTSRPSPPFTPPMAMSAARSASSPKSRTTTTPQASRRPPPSTSRMPGR